jgi:uncharacterized protein (DUF362 family)
MAATVFVQRRAGTPEGRRTQMQDALNSIGLPAEVRSARTVFLKPNLTFPEHKDGITTRAEFIEEIVSYLLATNSRLKIFVGEGEGGYNSFSMSGAMRTMGYHQVASRHPNVELVNLTSIPSTEVVLDTPKGKYPLRLPDLLLRDVDLAISCPVPKVHAMTTLTLSFKNLWGCLPDVHRLKNHYMFSYLISRVAEILRFRYAVLDGRFGLTRYGPMSGDAIEVNWFVAGNSLGAFDAVVARMMGFNWQKVPHLRQAGSYGYIPSDEDTNVLGDPEALRVAFSLRRVLWTYPAYAAFHSKYLTRFFYLSPYAKFMHDVMYMFRKRDILPQQSVDPPELKGDGNEF